VRAFVFFDRDFFCFNPLTVNGVDLIDRTAFHISFLLTGLGFGFSFTINLLFIIYSVQ